MPVRVPVKHQEVHPAETMLVLPGAALKGVVVAVDVQRLRRNFMLWFSERITFLQMPPAVAVALEKAALSNKYFVKRKQVTNHSLSHLQLCLGFQLITAPIESTEHLKH